MCNIPHFSFRKLPIIPQIYSADIFRIIPVANIPHSTFRIPHFTNTPSNNYLPKEFHNVVGGKTVGEWPGLKMPISVNI